MSILVNSMEFERNSLQRILTNFLIEFFQNFLPVDSSGPVVSRQVAYKNKKKFEKFLHDPLKMVNNTEFRFFFLDFFYFSLSP